MQTPYANTIYERLMIKTQQQKDIAELFNLKL